ncbi:hypothetical protein [Nocardia cyriacigeorgica]|uniref:hypothetical protein n=1 Tax=Nocardia cyriacigeorgica TaxID=135487 RepID=UPI0024574CF6|nr:hypothetical protein [Nocardia cyriacigeorgica]
MASPAEAVTAAVEAYVAELDDTEFAALAARTRAPQDSDARRTLARDLFGTSRTDK